MEQDAHDEGNHRDDIDNDSDVHDYGTHGY